VTVQFLEYVLPVLLEAHSVERVKYLLPNKPLRTLQLHVLQSQGLQSQSAEATATGSGATGASPAKAVTAKLDKISAKNSLIFSP